MSITPEQKSKPNDIPYWWGPYKLMNRPTQSRAFLEFLEKWIYGETSAQAHLNAAGLFSVAMFLVPDLVSEVEPKILISRPLEQFLFRHFSRHLATVLAIASEIENFCQLGNRVARARLWVTLGGYADEAKDLYEQRYQALLS